MTTIIATRQAIYTDTFCNYTVPFKARKAIRIGNALYAGAGDDLDSFIKVVTWLRGESPKPKLPGDETFEMLEVNQDGIFLWSRLLTRTQVHEKYYAIGTGAQYAIGAMDDGAPPERALKRAAGRDADTRLPIAVLRLAET